MHFYPTGFALQCNHWDLTASDVGRLVDLGDGPVSVSEELVDAGLSAVHNTLTSGGSPTEHIYDLQRQPVQEGTVWASHEPLALGKVFKAAKAAGLAVAYYDIAHKAEINFVQVC